MIVPNFLVIGAAKSGTSSLYEYLGQHPEIYTSIIKGPCYFAYEDGQKVIVNGPGDQKLFDRLIVTDRQQYLHFFHGVTDEKAIGEASVLYMYEPTAASRIRTFNPNIKLIACLRNPITRAYSSYLHLRRDAREPCAEFEDALAAENSRINAGWEHQWHYTRLGFYYEQLRRYYDLFSRDQIAIHLYDDFKKTPLTVIQDIYRFLDVDDSYVPDLSLRMNVSGRPRIRFIHELYTKPNVFASTLRRSLPPMFRRKAAAQLLQWNLVRDHKPISDRVHAQLRELYCDDIRKLEPLIQRDLSSWLEKAP